MAQRITIAVALAALGALASCTRDVARESRSRSGGRALPEAVRSREGGWRVFQGDFNGDGMADIVWSNPDGNRLAIWLMNGTELLLTGPELPGPSGSGWQPARPGDLNRDNLTDLFWENTERAVSKVWLMNGTQVLLSGPELPSPRGAGWTSVAAAVDFNFDSMADVVWNNRDRNTMSVWLMNGTQLLVPGPEIPGPSGDGWEVISVGDFNFDGMGDVLWSNRERSAMVVYLMNGTQLLVPGPEIPGPSPEGWSASKVFDFNFDGMVDVLWSHSGRGSMSIWLMNGTEVLLPGPEIAGPGGAGWTAATAGDYNFDRLADVVWFNAERGSIAIWLMAGTQVLLPGPEIPGPRGGAGP